MTPELRVLLVRAALAFSIGLLLVLLLRRPVRRAFGAQAAYLLWALAPAMLLAAFPPPTALSTTMMPRITAPARMAVEDWLMPATATDAGTQNWILACWCGGVALSVIVLSLQQLRFVRSLGTLRRSASGWHSQIDAGPALVGALRPRIVLPADFDVRYSERERALILAHEHVHLGRCDAQINALAALLHCLNWFNPLVHFAVSRFRFDQEAACDAQVISRFPEARRCYADAMLKTQLTGQARQELRLPVGCYWQSDHPLKERIMLLKKPIPAPARRALATACIVALIATGSIASWAAQPGAAQTAADAANTSIQLGELENIAPSENISYRRMSPPKYPNEAVKAHIGAKVRLKVLIGMDGAAQSVDVEELDLIYPKTARAGIDEAAISTAFARASIDAAKVWTYNPGWKEGKPYAGYAIVPIDYSVREDECGEGGHCKDAASGRS
jgi:beta-lactamase regulating signal transducer with metallopeptidase domain